MPFLGSSGNSGESGANLRNRLLGTADGTRPSSVVVPIAEEDDEATLFRAVPVGKRGQYHQIATEVTEENGRTPRC